MKDKSTKQHWPLSARLTVLILVWLWLVTAFYAFLFYTGHGSEERELIYGHIDMYTSQHGRS